jgi:nicotinate-nucleotide adenylyltransferase
MGGTFNPIHIAHLIMAESLMHSLDADGMIFVAARIHPIKQDGSIVSSYDDRIAMIKLAIAGNNRFIQENGPEDSGYTIDLITHLQQQYPAAQFFLPIGSDLINEFDSWYKHDEIEKKIRIIVATRPGYAAKDRKDGVLGDAQRLMIPQFDISSSEIRKRLRAEQSVRYMIPELVEKYIAEKRLYAE